MMALDFIDSLMFIGFDGSNTEYDRFEFFFCKIREEWKEKQNRFEEFNREFESKRKTFDDFFDENDFIS